MIHSTSFVELQRQFLALRRAGALPLQARLERRSLTSCALLTHRELSFIFSLGASLPPFLPNQVTLQLHFRCSHELRTISETFHIFITRMVNINCKSGNYGVQDGGSGILFLFFFYLPLYILLFPDFFLKLK